MIKVIWDVDGVLWDINDYIYKKLGIESEYSKRIHYKVELMGYSKEVEREIVRLYGDKEVFENVEFDDGVDEINKLELEGVCKSFIHSHNYTEEVAEIKRRRLTEKLVEIPKSRMRLDVLRGTEVVIKELEESDVVVEDSLDNLINCKAKLKILIEQPYNIMEMSKKDYGIDVVKNVSEAVWKIREYASTK